MMMRIGLGYDLHRLTEGKKLFLGGVEIPFSKGPIAHSDGDVLLHALCDGLLGATGEGDIGMHFPDTKPEYEGMSGIELLKRTYEIIQKKNRYNIVNIDTVIICDEPKITEYTDKIKANIAKRLDIAKDQINIKAKTTENTAKETISSYAVVLIETA